MAKGFRHSFLHFGWIVLCLLITFGGVEGCKSGKKGRKQASTEGLTGGILIFEDDFERDTLGDHWIDRKGQWRIEKGKLKIARNRNEGLWLTDPLPERVRIEFDAVALEDEGDIKCEVFASEPRHQTGYIVILGGWHNTVSVIARLDEHGTDRLESSVLAQKGKVHHFVLVRTGDTLRWFLDGNLVLEYHDEEPLRGRYFGFNNWNSQVEFDNLKIYQL